MSSVPAALPGAPAEPAQPSGRETGRSIRAERLAAAARRVPLRLLGRRVIALPLLAFLVASVGFLVMHVLPGDPARQIAGQYAAPFVLREIRAKLGINQSLWHQYTTFVSNLVQGNLGTSYYSGRPVGDEIFSRLPSDIELALAAVVFALAWGLLAGTISAYFRNRRTDTAVRFVVSIEQSVPDFVAGLLLIYLLAFRLGALPEASGQLALAASPPGRITGSIVLDSLLRGDWSTLGDACAHLVLPAVSLGFVIAAVFARVTRSSLGDALRSPQVEFARACGVRERTVLAYAASVARTPVITYLAIILGALFGGTAIIETVFNWNGASQWVVTSITKSDLPAVQGFIVVTAVFTLVLYVLLDVTIAVLDPRVRLR